MPNIIRELIMKAGELFGRLSWAGARTFLAGVVAGVWRAARGEATAAVRGFADAVRSRFPSKGKELMPIFENITASQSKPWLFVRKQSITQLEAAKQFIQKYWVPLVGGAAGGGVLLYNYLGNSDGPLRDEDIQGGLARYSALQQSGVIARSNDFLRSIYEQGLPSNVDRNQSVDGYLAVLDGVGRDLFEVSPILGQLADAIKSYDPGANASDLLIGLALTASDEIQLAAGKLSDRRYSDDELGLIRRALLNGLIILPETFLLAIAESGEGQGIYGGSTSAELSALRQTGVNSIDNSLRSQIVSIRRLEELTGLSGMSGKGVPLLAEYLNLVRSLSPDDVSRYYEARNVFLDR